MTPDTTTQIRTLIDSAQNILVSAHYSPDGDALGSLTAMGQALQQLGKTFTLANDDAVLPRFAYLPLSESVVRQPHGGKPYDLLIALDCGDETRLGRVYEKLPQPHPPIINIDHHITNNYFGTVNVVESGMTSTAEVLTELLPQLGVEITRELATSLLTGVVTDTLAFRVTGVSGHTLRMASKLVDAGADLAEITLQALVLKSASSLEMWRIGLNNMALEDGVAWSSLTVAEQNQVGDELSSSMGLGNLLADVEEAALSIVFTEKRDGRVNISYRSRPPIDVAGLAMARGGGGHRNAAGCTVYGRLQTIIPEVVEEAKASVLEQRASVVASH